MDTSSESDSLLSNDMVQQAGVPCRDGYISANGTIHSSGQGARGTKQSRLERIAERWTSMIWIAAAGILLSITDIHCVFYDNRFNNTAARYALTAALMNFTIYLYIQYWPKLLKRPPIDMKNWKTSAPMPIYLATSISVLFFLASTVALWPMYHVLTFLIEFVLFMAFLNIVSLF
jgi:hypothetical protein